MVGPKVQRTLAPAEDLLMALGHLIRARDRVDLPLSLNEALALDDTKEAVERVRSAMRALEREKKEWQEEEQKCEQ